MVGPCWVWFINAVVGVTGKFVDQVLGEFTLRTAFTSTAMTAAL